MRNAESSLGILCALLLTLSAGGASADGIDKQEFKQIEHGRYLTIVGDCAACHTLPGSGHDLAGGRAIETPFGKLLAPNITPDPATGIGAWTDDEFVNAMIKGTGRNGVHLYPAMPYTYYTKVTREDALAIRAYLNTVPAVQNAVDANQLPFPFDIRAAMRVWNQLYFTPGTFTPNPNKSAEWNRGAYLAEGLGHCGLCHTPKNHPRRRQDQRAVARLRIAGMVRGGHHQRSAPRGRQLVGRRHRQLSQDRSQLRPVCGAGLMAETIGQSTSHMNDADLKAIAVYLKDQSGPGDSQVDPPRAGPIDDDGRGENLCRRVFRMPCGKRQRKRRSISAASRFGARSTDRSDLADACRAARRAQRCHRRRADRGGDASVRLAVEGRRGCRGPHLYPQCWGNAAPAVGAGEVGKARRAFVERTD